MKVYVKVLILSATKSYTDRKDHVNRLPELIHKKEVEQLEEYEKDLEYLLSHYQDLIAKYGNQSFIAIKNERVYGNDTDPERLEEYLEKEYGDLSQFLIRYLGRLKTI